MQSPLWPSVTPHFWDMGKLDYMTSKGLLEVTVRDYKIRESGDLDLNCGPGIN